MNFALPKRRKRERFNSREETHYRNRSYLAHIRGFRCTIADKHECEGRIEAAHVRNGTDGGMSQKPSDFYTVPLCWKAHGEQHQVGETTFWSKYGIDPLKVADRLWKASKHYREWINNACLSG